MVGLFSTALISVMVGVSWTPVSLPGPRPGSGNPGGTPVAAPIATSAPPTATVTAAVPMTGTAAGDCGAIRTRGPNPPSDPAALQAESCFLNAFQSCHPATLKLASQGVDTGGTTTLSVTVDSAGCHVDGSTTTVFVPRSSNTVTYSCGGVIEQDGGLLVQSCGQYGDIEITAPAVP